MEGVIEFHGFTGNHGEFIIKELAIVSDDNFYTILHFRSPYDKSELKPKYERTASWLERNYHHINWEYGDTSFSSNNMRVLCSRLKTIYTKGRQKQEFLRRFHHDVRLIPENSPKPINISYTVNCPYHTIGRCALSSACFYMRWLKQQRKPLDFTREVDRLLTFNNTNIDNKEDLASTGFYYSFDEEEEEETPSRCVIKCFYCRKNLENHNQDCFDNFKENVPQMYENIVPRKV